MAKLKKKAAPKKQEPDHSTVSVDHVAEVAIDLWKIAQRAKRDGVGERVTAACERADDRLRRLGFQVETLEGRPYDTNLKARVVEHEESDHPLMVAECLSPAVYFRGQLLREAEIVTRGTH